MNALPTKWPLLDYILEEFSLELLLWLQKSIPGTRPSTQIDSVLLDLEFSSAVLSLAVTSDSCQRQAKILVEHCITESQEVSWTIAILGKGHKNNRAYRYKYNYDIPPKWLQTQYHDIMLNSITKHCHNREAHLMVVIVDLPAYTSGKAILPINSKIDVVLTSETVSLNLV